MQQNTTLVLFDIDGTLIRSVSGHKTLRRFPYAIYKVFQKEIAISEHSWPYNGLLESSIVWELVKAHGLTKKKLMQDIPRLARVERQYLEKIAVEGELFKPIDDAMQLVQLLSTMPTMCLGIVSGNFAAVGEWKLAHTGYTPYFSYSVYGDVFFDRNEMVKSIDVSDYKDVVLVGDTKYDVMAGFAIHAKTIAVSTSYDRDDASLRTVTPDILVDSLMDPLVRDFFGV